MRFDLKTPCKNCPFRTDETAIRFQCLERAEEIEESAYRNGFPCHLSADLEEDEGDAGYVFGGNTQHCAGALLMFARHGDGPVPFTRLSEAKQEAVLNRLDWSAPVFESEADFLDSYGPTDSPTLAGHEAEGVVSKNQHPKEAGEPATNQPGEKEP
ncbi:MAG: hypothetical protein ACK4FB_07835 [Brevundimonas sp.]|uniref:hypothetical protein n=1 Tax=Brevundimonas sp. TaxID=1871086 RepID=UPI00391A74D2